MPLITTMAKVKVKTLQSVRLDGKDVSEGQMVDIDENLVFEWVSKGFATTSIEETKSNDNADEKKKSEHKTNHKKSKQ